MWLSSAVTRRLCLSLRVEDCCEFEECAMYTSIDLNFDNVFGGGWGG